MEHDNNCTSRTEVLGELLTLVRKDVEVAFDQPPTRVPVRDRTGTEVWVRNPSHVAMRARRRRIEHLRRELYLIDATRR